MPVVIGFPSRPQTSTIGLAGTSRMTQSRFSVPLGAVPICIQPAASAGVNDATRALRAAIVSGGGVTGTFLPPFVWPDVAPPSTETQVDDRLMTLIRALSLRLSSSVSSV